MSRRAGLWIAFVAVHLVVTALGFVLPNMPMGDVVLVYEPWARDAVAGDAIAGVTAPWIYPQLALAPMILALGLEWIAGYEIAWALVVTIVDALAFALLVGRGTSRGRTRAAMFWLAFMLLLGPAGMYRLDAITVPLAIAGCLWLVGRPLVASILLAVATWIKVWPAALLIAAVIAVRRRLLLIAGGALVTAATLLAVIAAGGAGNAFGFIEGQTGRGLQLEAPITAPFLWQAVAGVPGAFVYYASDILTFQVSGAHVDAVIALMTPLLVAVVAAIALFGALRAWQGASFAALFPALALCLVLAMIVVNKVGSPQFETWLIAPLVMGLVLDQRRWRGPAMMALGVALLTQLVYPLLYHRLLSADAVGAAVLTARNALLVALFVWAFVRLVRVPLRERRSAPATAPPGTTPPAN